MDFFLKWLEIRVSQIKIDFLGVFTLARAHCHSERSEESPIKDALLDLCSTYEDQENEFREAPYNFIN